MCVWQSRALFFTHEVSSELHRGVLHLDGDDRFHEGLFYGLQEIKQRPGGTDSVRVVSLEEQADCFSGLHDLISVHACKNPEAMG